MSRVCTSVYHQFCPLGKSQLKNNSVNKDPRHRRWDPEIISMSLSLWCRSPRAYSALKGSGMLVLPSERLLRYYKNCVRQQPGLQTENLEWMKSEADRRNLPLAGYHGGLLIDEMSVQDDLQIEQQGDVWKVTGAIDMGILGNHIRTVQKGAKRMKMATYVLQVLFHGFTGFSWPVAYYAADTADSTQLATVIWEICSALDDIGFSVDYLMTDGAASNRGLFNMLCGGNARQAGYLCTDVYDVTHSISLVQDPKHCIKKIPNSVLSSKIKNSGRQRKLELDGKFIVWDHWEKAHQFNQSLGITKYAALSDDHIYMTNELKMRNHLAEQVLNKDMLHLMLTYQKTLAEDKQSELDGTIKFLQITSRLVSLFCDEQMYVTSTGHQAFTTAQDILQFFLQWECGTPEHKQQRCLITREAREDIQSALQGFVHISKLCIDLDSPLKSGVFNSDLVENFFCQQRGISNGLNTNPTISQYGPGVNAIILGQGCISRKSNAGKSLSTLPMKSLKPTNKLNKAKQIRC